MTEIGKHYTDLKFRDFKHGITGAMLWKAQHPDVENLLQLQAPGGGRRVLAVPHAEGQGSEDGQDLHVALADLAEALHQGDLPDVPQATWSEKQAKYAIDSLKNRFAGKVRKAEFWLTRFVDKFEEAQNLGVDAKALDAAREQALRRARELGMVDGLQRLALPQPGARPPSR